jgi:NitT/TauT family transport system permease protein
VTRARFHRLFAHVVPPLLPAVAVVVAVELLVRGGVIQAFLVPPPSKVAVALVENVDVWQAAGQTATAAGVGFTASTVLGVLTAVLLSSAVWVRRAFYPYAVFFQTVPIVAIAPLLVIWIGFGIKTVIASAFIVSFFPVVANTLTGLLSTDPALRDLFRLYGAGPVATLWKLRLPAALPSILTGLRVAGGLAVIGAIVGEFITGTGIGDVIAVSRQMGRVDKIYAVLLLAAALGMVLLAVINLASALLLRHWHPSERKP